MNKTSALIPYSLKQLIKVTWKKIHVIIHLYLWYNKYILLEMKEENICNNTILFLKDVKDVKGCRIQEFTELKRHSKKITFCYLHNF